MTTIISDGLSDIFSEPLKYGGVKERIEVYQMAENNTYTPAQIIRIRIPSCEIADMRNCVLEFNATCSQTGGVSIAFAQPIACLFDRVRLLSNSLLIDDILSYGRMYAAKLMSEDNTEWSSSLTITDGVGIYSARAANAASTTIVYQVKLGYIMEVLDRCLPVGWMGNNQFTLELYCAGALNVLENDGTGTNPTYVITNPQLHYANINVTDEYKKMLNTKFAKDGISFSFRSFDNYISNLPASSAGTVYTTLPFKKQKAISILGLATVTANLTVPTALNKFISFANYSYYGSSRLKINATYIPSDRVLNSYEQYLQVCDCFDLPYKNNSYIANNWLSGNAFMLGQTIAPNPRNTSNDSIIQGIDISQGNSNCISELTF